MDSITIQRHADYKFSADFTDTDMTGSIIKSQIRTQPDQDAELLAEFTVSADPDINYRIWFSLTAVQTAAILTDAGYCDIRWTDTGTFIRQSGIFKINFVDTVTV